jgi:hypothetical protein
MTTTTTDTEPTDAIRYLLHAAIHCLDQCATELLRKIASDDDYIELMPLLDDLSEVVEAYLDLDRNGIAANWILRVKRIERMLG